MWISLILCLAAGPVQTGLDRMVADDFAPLRGARVMILTNHSALNRRGKHLVDLVRGIEGLKIVGFLAPEHGFAGQLDQEHIADSTEGLTGLRIYSLYGKHRRPTAEMLAGVDVLLFDIQDIGTRFYTYQTTLLYALEACAEHGIALHVLDRPNPIGGQRLDGPMLDADRFSFVGSFPMPVVHGMTMAELARMFKAERQLEVKLTWTAMKGWRRAMTFDETGLPWINPSPNMRNLNQAILYPAIGVLEYTNLSVGRGTDTPFELLGAPWIDPMAFVAKLRQARLPGIALVPRFFTPQSGPYAGEHCGGVNLLLREADDFQSMRVAYTIYRTLRDMYPRAYSGEKFLKLLGNQTSFIGINQGTELESILAREARERSSFLKIRKKYLLYK